MFRNKSFLDLFWSFADNILQQLINFVIGIILARILLPQEFGLVGIITVFITLSNVFVDGGFSAALINKKEVKNIDYNTVFYTNLGISLVLYGILFLFAPWIAEFFNNPEISGLLRIAGINIILLSFSAIHRTIIVRNLNFRLITIISIIAVSISAVCAIYMAYNGYGVYSLVFRAVLGQLITVILFWLLNKWKPTLEFSVQSFKQMFNYGVNLFASNLLNTLHSNVYYLLIGKYFSPSQLGYYTRATTFRDLASTNISNTIKRVSFSTLSKIHDNELRYRKFIFFRNIAYLLTSLSMMFLFFLSKEIILILLSEKWMESVLILKTLSVAGVSLALYNLNLDYLAVLGNTKLYLKIEIIGKLLIVPVVVVGILWGFEPFLYAMVIQNLLMFVIVTYNLNRLKKGILLNQSLLVLKFLVMISILIAISNIKLLDIPNLYIATFVKGGIVLSIFTIFNIKQLSVLKNKK